MTEPSSFGAAPPGRLSAKDRKRSLILMLIGLGVAIIVFGFVLPQVIDYQQVWDTIRSLSFADLLVLLAAGLIYYVPYDFDLAGIVNAPYAKPLPEMRLRDVRQRRYRGFCTDADILLGAIRQVNARRDYIFELIRGTPGLSPRNVEQAVGYLEGYFDRAADEDAQLKAFERACKEL